jgi:hypothetical protein
MNLIQCEYYQIGEKDVLSGMCVFCSRFFKDSIKQSDIIKTFWWIPCKFVVYFFEEQEKHSLCYKCKTIGQVHPYWKVKSIV